MLKYIGKRVLYMIFVFFIMSLVMFFLYNLIPGDPARAELEPLKKTMRPEAYQMRYEQLRKQMGLDDPIIVKYGKWIGGVLQGDFGMSTRHKKPVVDLIKAPMGNTIFINIFATILALGISIPLGIKCAVKRNSVMDNVVQVLTIVGYSLPIFIITLVSIFLFAVTLRWFPVSGMNTPNFHGTGIVFFLDRMHYLALPLIVMTIGSLGGMTRYVRAAMIEALRMDYIRTARAKGLKEKVVIYSHAWRNALLPVITLIIGWFISIFSGSLVIEQMFNLNGMGKFYMDALMNQDYNVALAVQMFYMVVALIGNLIIDLSYGFVDPRVRVNH
ncbi:ABC transporter permease [Anaerocolumna xylanovorans]|uniref:Peptide/nickel transport system permease protein n=1 Tax=Anaerocolumna xylanovorans DSM 12503 TaxID=1121345 RepID=A0A1M7YJ72_9FIRM|nr:ABC transporter permease [Anaerocolumna xylanovorans]SHO52641.1 peptide/nickel transport system permease protein [Anaerocolumna xylanovorans DSM 12503]